jgi:hypothetical protein
MHDSRFLASLAIELLARNFYERANDCRWWALNATLGGRLAGAPDCTDEAATRVLRHINSLYTVYHAIVLFDSQQRIVASSRPDQEGMLGSVIGDSWASDALALSGTQPSARPRAVAWGESLLSSIRRRSLPRCCRMRFRRTSAGRHKPDALPCFSIAS